MNHLSDIHDFLENDCKNIKFVGYVVAFIIFHLSAILKSGIGNMKREARDF